MKIDLGPLDPDAIPSARGAFYVRDTLYGPRAQAWPRRGAYPKSELNRLYRKRFGFAAIMAASPNSLEYQTAVHLSEGTQQVPRDLLTMAALGRFYDFYWEDGTQLQNLQGPLAYTRPELETSMWEWAQWDAAWTATMDTGAFASKGVMFTPSWNDPIRSVRVIFTTVNAAIYKLTAGYVNAGNVIQAITVSSSQVAVGNLLQCLQFDFDYTFVANQKNFLVLTRTDGAANYVLPINVNQVKRWLYPVTNQGTCRIASVNPVVGNTLLIVTAANASPFGFRINQ